MSFAEVLKANSDLSQRKTESEKRLREIADCFSEDSFLKDKNLTVFVAGSMGRFDSGKSSDLDLFVISTADRENTTRASATSGLSRLDEYTLFSVLIAKNNKLGYPEFSNDGRYLNVYHLDDLKSKTGSPSDDSENLFTTRMLLLLESRPVFNELLYDESVRSIAEHYCRDQAAHDSFKPLFVLNDLLRYWRTLCLNYEEIRHDPKRKWRKRNVNLKFSRMLTVFATVLYLITTRNISQTQLYELRKLTPLERLATGLDNLRLNVEDYDKVSKEFDDFLESYSGFLKLKEDEKIKDTLEVDTKAELDRRAERFSQFLYEVLMHANVSADYRKYLVI